MEPEGFAKQAFPAVANNRPAQLPGDGQAQALAREAILRA